MNYYVLQVRTGSEEKFIKSNDDINCGYETLYSLIFLKRMLKIRKSGKVQEVCASIFPGYIFMAAENFTPEVFKRIKQVKGFYRFLPNNQEPSVLHGRDLDILTHFISFGGIAKLSTVTFDEHDRIKVIEGPLKGLEGNIISVNKRKGRAKVILDMCQTPFSIDLGFDFLTSLK